MSHTWVLNINFYDDILWSLRIQTYKIVVNYIYFGTLDQGNIEP